MNSINDLLDNKRDLIMHCTFLYKTDVNEKLANFFLLKLTLFFSKQNLNLRTCPLRNCCCLHTFFLFITIVCVQSYGENCRYPCAPHCYNQTCDRFNGWCVWVCKNGFYGKMCERGNYFLILIVQILILNNSHFLRLCVVMLCVMYIYNFVYICQSIVVNKVHYEFCTANANFYQIYFHFV